MVTVAARAEIMPEIIVGSSAPIYHSIVVGKTKSKSPVAVGLIRNTSPQIVALDSPTMPYESGVVPKSADWCNPKSTAP